MTTLAETFHAPAFSTQVVVDTLGASDAFNGGFIAACLAQADVRQAATWGNATAALKIARAGARGLPSLSDLKKLLEPTWRGLIRGFDKLSPDTQREPR
ncbi:carbohydrate kinase family protein [Candidatus Bipolaricaulota bacterium]